MELPNDSTYFGVEAFTMFLTILDEWVSRILLVEETVPFLCPLLETSPQGY